MIRMAILGSAAAFAMSLPAAAQTYAYSGQGYDGYGYQGQGYYNGNCERERRNNQTAGTVVGAIAGGLIGAAIADDGDDKYRRRGHHRYSRGWDRGYGYGYRGRRHHRGNDDGDKIAGALIGGVVGAVAGNAIAGSSSNDCQTRVYSGQQTNPRYGNMGVPAPTRQPYGQGWQDNRSQPVTYDNGYDNYQGGYDVRDGEELYGGTSYNSNPAWSDPEYGATATGYNAGYSAPQNTGECRTVYRETYVNGRRASEPATACNVGGDRWEFAD
ncbi:glycine zipper 2TM domain-containing protein [Henriciella sp.]|uniref:glycine zipper 2TM domain-containing protein n=1 Tax=Henriciella sp. TaxID=1968823 RepID=UPI00261030B6|nr:glycine zipper 2TM domain-containing protein [Henriciella sp.]